MKNLLVTGAAGGIGSEIASHASKNGYRVGLMDANHEKLKEVESAIENSISLPVDITQEDSVKNALDLFGETPDGLVNCAGIVRFGSLLEQEVKDFEDVINVNLLGCFIVSCAVARLMQKKGSGNIVNISSISGGKHPAIHSGAYAASKAGVVMLSEQMSLEWGKEGIRVNAISPGPTLKNKRQSEKHFKKQWKSTILKKKVDTKNVSSAVKFLINNSNITGQIINVDSGQRLAWQTPDIINAKE